MSRSREVSRYFEDYRVGDKYRHGRGRTVTEHENTLWTLATLNTAEAHFNTEYGKQLLGGAFSERLVMGGFVLAVVLGLTTEDMAENAVAEVGLRDVKFRNAVYPGDTLYAASEVVAVSSSERPDAGVVSYRFVGSKGEGAIATEGVRDVLVLRRDAGRRAE